MADASAWQTLGIAPTEDKRAIKRAYAAKLKATDVENDPRAFIALREALETATWEADYLQYREQLDEPEPATAESQVNDALEAEMDMYAQAQRYHEPVVETAPAEEDVQEEGFDDAATWRWEPERQPETEADQERIVQLLWGDAPTQEIEVELAERTHRILTAPEMEQIDHASGIEDWMASIIAQSIPRSDVMARIAVPHFGWEEHADDWRQRYGVSAAAARLRDLDALDRLMKPDHRWNKAFELLRQPPPDAAGWNRVAKHKADILALLASIRHHTPALEHELDADHVAQWEPALAASGGTVEKKSGWGFRWWWWVLIALWGFIQLARSVGDVAPPPTSVPPIQQAEYVQWRAEQMPDVQKWMDANRGEIDRLFANQKARGPGLPSCASLDAVADLTREQYVYCEDNEQKRRRLAVAPFAPAAPAAGEGNPRAVSRLIYSSPLWRSEQAPRVQRWMDANPDAIDRLLQPHIKAGGLPSCAKLGAAARMTPSELSQCRSAEAARIAARVTMGANPRAPPLPVESAPPAPAAPKVVSPAESFCERPEYAGTPVCKNVTKDAPTAQ